MHRRVVLRAALLTSVVLGSAQAGPTHPGTAAHELVARARNRAALVAWKPRAWTPPTAVATPSAGLRVERDPTDGTLSMPAPDRFGAQLVEGERRPVSVTRLPNGAIRAQLDESFAEFAVVRLGADGKPHWSCVQGPEGVQRFMRMSVTPVRTPAPGTVWEDK